MVLTAPQTTQPGKNPSMTAIPAESVHRPAYPTQM